ncbi:MAG: hypothetical protein ACLQSR_17400 [Limisphaerales bacterium]
MRFQAGIVGIFRQAPQSRFDLRFQQRVLPDQATESPSKLGRGNKPGLGSFAFAQAGDEAFSRLTLEFAGAKSSDGALGLRRRFPAPRFDTTLAQKTFEHFLLVCRKRLGFGQDAI